MRNRAFAVGGVVLIALTLLLASGYARSLGRVADPERSSTVPTEWYWYAGVSPGALNNLIESKKLRIIDLASDSATTFSAVLVRNAGIYARAWWWYYGLTAADLSNKLASLHARVIDLHPYNTRQGLRFAVALVRNAGVSAKGWWWYYGMTAVDLASKLAENGARLIDLDAYRAGGATRYAAVMVKNTGVDASGWWWYVGATPSFITQKLKENNARLIELDPDGPGRFDVVMVKSTGENWWWYFGINVDQVNGFLTKNDARLIDLHPYTSGGSKRYAALMIQFKR